MPFLFLVDMPADARRHSIVLSGHLCPDHSVKNVVAEVTFQFWAIFGNFGQFLDFFAFFGHFYIFVKGYLSNHIFHTVPIIHSNFANRVKNDAKMVMTRFKSTIIIAIFGTYV